MVVDHDQVYDIFRSMHDSRIIASYIGIFDRNILITLGKNFKETLVEDMTQAKRFFKVFIELASNIAYYSKEKSNNSGIGTIIIKENAESLEISAGNLVDDKDKNALIKKIELINNLNRDELRTLKRQLLREPSQNNNGNIGLVQVALISHYPISYRFFNLDNGMYFFIITIKLDKVYNKNPNIK